MSWGRQIVLGLLLRSDDEALLHDLPRYAQVDEHSSFWILSPEVITY
jgi:hypothetical protein